MANITIDAAQLQALLDTVKAQDAALKRSARSESERIREDAARQESRQRQHSLSIAADFEERNRGRAFQVEWDEAYSNLGRIAPAMREGETAEAYRLRLAIGVQNCSPDHRDLDLETVLFRQPEILSRNDPEPNPPRCPASRSSTCGDTGRTNSRVQTTG